MPKGFHIGRTQSRHYTCEYYRIHALWFKEMLTSRLGQYSIPFDQLSKEHQVFKLIETKYWGRIAEFNIKGQKIPIPLKIDKRSVSNKLFFICPYCRHQRQHLYAVANTYACRKCLNLQYACQSERLADRLARRIRKLRAVIWSKEPYDTVSLFDSCKWYPKPKWMRWEKFNRERDKVIDLENRYWKSQEAFMAQYAKMGIEW